jgi:predicted transcriptional regulator of viral defense system
MKPSVLSRIAKKYSTTSVLQRLGYILDRVLNEEKLADSLYKVLIDRNPLPVPLSIEKGKTGEIDEKWNVIKNMEIESDL